MNLQIWLLKKKKKKGFKIKQSPIFFKRKPCKSTIKRQNWLLENQELFLMHWPRKTNCKVLWGFLKIYKKNWWAVLVNPDILLSCFKWQRIQSHTIQFHLDCKRHSRVMPSAWQNYWAKRKLAFISSRADKRRHWGQVQKGWSPQIWKSNVGKQDSECWWLQCMLCWALLP